MAVVILSASVDSIQTLQLLKLSNALPIVISLAFTVLESESIAIAYTPARFCTIRYFPFAFVTVTFVPSELMTALSVPVVYVYRNV